MIFWPKDDKFVIKYRTRFWVNSFYFWNIWLIDCFFCMWKRFPCLKLKLGGDENIFFSLWHFSHPGIHFKNLCFLCYCRTHLYDSMSKLNIHYLICIVILSNPNLIFVFPSRLIFCSFFNLCVFVTVCVFFLWTENLFFFVAIVTLCKWDVLDKKYCF